MMYKTFIPTLIEDYQISVDPLRLNELRAIFNRLNDILSTLSEDDKLQLVWMEAKDSWRLAEYSPLNPFSFTPGNSSTNVENIVRATLYADEALGELPISTRLIRNIHYMICAGTDYDRKYRGEYRISPVWIGKPGCGLQDAAFVPPAADDMNVAIADLENYINYAEENVFVKSAVIHYQFEMIHPFVDGNGRTGRLLNNLFLKENGAIISPSLLVSHVISRDYNRYCDEIQHVNETNDMSVWVTYWLETMLESVQYTLRVIGYSKGGVDDKKEE